MCKWRKAVTCAVQCGIYLPPVNRKYQLKAALPRTYHKTYVSVFFVYWHPDFKHVVRSHRHIYSCVIFIYFAPLSSLFSHPRFAKNPRHRLPNIGKHIVCVRGHKSTDLGHSFSLEVKDDVSGRRDWRQVKNERKTDNWKLKIEIERTQRN